MQSEPQIRKPMERLDVAQFVKTQKRAEGVATLADFPRLLREAANGTQASAVPVRWEIDGEGRVNAAGEVVPWLLVRANVALPMECQRCLQPVEEQLSTEQWFRFVATEEQAEIEDEDALEDVMALDQPLNMQLLIEDDLLMALPPVAKHAVCQAPEVLASKADVPPESLKRPNPFAQLATLRVGSKPSGESAD